MFRNYYYYLSFSNLETIAGKYPENVLIGANIIGFADTIRKYMLKSNYVTIQEIMAHSSKKKNKQGLKQKKKSKVQFVENICKEPRIEREK